jgi:hypothetical protein
MERPPRRVDGITGFSVIELTIVLGVVAVIGSLAVGSLITLRAEARALGGPRYLAARLGEERAAAVRRGAAGGLFFTRASGDYAFQRVVDGNGNGLRADEVGAGVDRLLDPPLRLEALFPGVQFRVVRPVPAVDGDGPGLVEGAEPLRIGGTRFVAFGPNGTGTSGTLYLGTRDGRQLAVRLFGVTGRVRVFEFSVASGQWVAR